MICNKCHKEKPLQDFPSRKNTKLSIRKTCKICTNKNHSKWWKKTAPLRLEYAQKWYANNREKVIKQKIASNLKYRRLARLDCIEHYSLGKNCCECCGEKHLEFLAIDHINGGGGKHRKKLGNNKYMTKILKSLSLRKSNSSVMI